MIVNILQFFVGMLLLIHSLAALFICVVYLEQRYWERYITNLAYESVDKIKKEMISKLKQELAEKNRLDS